MPELFDIAKHFDDTPVYDAYTGDFVFNGQFSTFNASTSDGSVNKRRVLSLAPDLEIPPRRALTFYDEQWIVGDGSVDAIYSRPIRRSYWMKRVTDSFTLLTPAQACLGSAGTVIQGYRRYLKDGVNMNTSSEYDPFWEIYTVPIEGVAKGSILRVGSTVYRARSSFRAVDGLQLALSDQLDRDVQSLVFYNETYNPVTDSKTHTTTTVPGLQLDAYQLWVRNTQADPKNLAGDTSLLVAKSSLTPIAGQVFTISSVKWQVLTVVSELDAWLIHARRQG